MDLDAALAELDERNRDNVSRTASYLELYAHTRAHPPDQPWLLMAHLVSRNAGYAMTDMAHQLRNPERAAAMGDAMRWLFVLLERANFLIFHDAWHHVIHALAGRAGELAPPRTPAFMCEAWRRHTASAGAGDADERSLVLDLVHNEQHLIEHRAVHHPALAPGLRLLELIEASGRERPLHFPGVATEIRVGRFADLARRIATGGRIFDEILADRARRDALFAWAQAHPHTGSRAAYGGPAGLELREAWPLETVRALWPEVHALPAPDPHYP